MKAKYCMYCGHNLEDTDRLEGCCNNCADKLDGLVVKEQLKGV